jgi:excisionase family DNA binding protein
MKEPTDAPIARATATESAFLSRGEVARLFGVCPSTVTRWARLGLLKALRTRGGHYRFPAAETRRAVNRGSRADTPERD